MWAFCVGKKKIYICIYIYISLARGRPGCLCLRRHSSKGTLFASFCAYHVFRCRFTEDASILDLGGLQLTILWRCWPVLNGSFAMSLISTVGTHGGGAASYLYSFCAVYVCWSLALMSDGPTAAKAFGSASPRPLGVAWDTRHKAFKVFLSTQCKAESLG